MSWPASQRRALSQIEKTLAADHPGLGPLFAIFTRLTDQEAMPVTEQARPWRLRQVMWPAARQGKPKQALRALNKDGRRVFMRMRRSRT
jgi:hypothetical protein